MMPKKMRDLNPQEVIVVLNRSYQAARESSSRETVDAAQKGLNNCIKWLKDRRIPFRQTPKGEWVLSD